MLFKIIRNLLILCCKRHSLLLFLLIFAFGASGLQASGQTKDKLTLADFTEMQTKKKRIVEKELETKRFYDNLIKKADKALNAGPFSVMNKTGVPPSGDKHDYMTLAPYFWPNPNTPDGLPYIRKDGEINPETRDDYTDYNEKERFFNSLDVLGKAFFYSDNQVYAEKAISLIKIWFLDEATKMNPHLNYGQGIPGVNNGRPFGIIEFGGISELIKCLEILEEGNALDPSTKSGMKNWLKNYIHWLQTSEIGIMESTRSNNHGTWYDVQLCSILLYLGDTGHIQEILEKAKTKRIASQIEPDGSQPHELARTKSFSYSTMNLSALTRLAWFGQQVGVDLWNYETPDGRSIKKAYWFLMPYITTNKEWKYQQLSSTGDYKIRFINLVEDAGETFNESAFIEIGEKRNTLKPK